MVKNVETFVWGWIMPQGFHGTARKTFEDQELLIARGKLASFDFEQRQLGRDPQWIGAHEVRPVICRCCGEPIPWEVVRGYSR
jgi:hypothetical protein